MHVVLSHQAWNSIHRLLPALHVERMREHRKPAGRLSHVYVLPAIGWRQVLDILTNEAFGERGGKRKDRPASFYTALKRIQASVSMMEHHPALTRGAITGESNGSFLLWQQDGRLSPYPGDDESTCLHFHPHTDVMAGHIITEWHALPPYNLYGRYELAPSSHYEFYRPMA